MIFNRLILGLLSIIGCCNGDLMRIYPTKDFSGTSCGNDSFTPKLINYTEKELKEKCSAFRYAEIWDCDTIKCCNNNTINDNQSLYKSLNTNPEENIICPKKIGYDFGETPLYGAPTDKSATIYELISTEGPTYYDAFYKAHNFYAPPTKWYSYDNYQYAACLISGTNIVTSGDETDVFVIISYITNIQKIYIDPASKFRIWDFGGDCHNTLYSNFINVYPVGKNQKSLALYIKPGFEFKNMIVKSTPYFDGDINDIDKLYKQYVPIKLENWNYILQTDDLDLSVEYGGNFECLNQCRIQSRNTSGTV